MSVCDTTRQKELFQWVALSAVYNHTPFFEMYRAKRER